MFSKPSTFCNSRAHLDVALTVVMVLANTTRGTYPTIPHFATLLNTNPQKLGQSPSISHPEHRTKADHSLFGPACSMSAEIYCLPNPTHQGLLRTLYFSQFFRASALTWGRLPLLSTPWMIP